MTISPQHAEVLESIVGELKKLPIVRAVASYGSTAKQEWTPYSDIDLFVIISAPAAIESLHFFIDRVPVDLNIRDLDRWANGDFTWIPLSGLKALWDPDNLFASMTQAPISPAAADHSRFGHRHTLMKLDQWQGADPEAAKLLVAAATNWIMASYFDARQLPFPGIDGAVRFLRQQEPELLAALLAALDHPVKQVELLRRASELALYPVGGMWRNDEVIAFGWSGPPDPESTAQGLALFQNVLDLRNVRAGSVEPC